MKSRFKKIVATILATILISGMIPSIPQKAVYAYDTTQITLQQDLNGYTGARDVANIARNVNYGAGGLTTANCQATYGLLTYFDLAGQIPAGAVIDSASLSLYSNLSYPGTAKLYRILDPDNKGMWTEGTGTSTTSGQADGATGFFRNKANSTTWSNSGSTELETSYSSTQTGTITLTNNSSYKWFTSTDLTADIQAFVDNPASNQGWWITFSTTFYNVITKENADAVHRPKLDITYHMSAISTETQSAAPTQTLAPTDTPTPTPTLTPTPTPTLTPTPVPTPTADPGTPVTLNLQNGVNGYNGSIDVSGIREYTNADGSSWVGYFSDGQDGNLKIMDDGIRGWSGLINFDVSQIPAGSVITSAQLKLYAYWGIPGKGTIDLFRITDNDNKGMWVEGVLQNPADPLNCYYSTGAAFLKRDGAFDRVANPGWTNVAGSTIMDSVAMNAGVPVASSSSTFTTGSIGWKSFDVTNDIQSFVNGTINQGWYMRPRMGTGINTAFATNQVEKNSNAGNNIAYRPKLEITYVSNTQSTVEPTQAVTPTPTPTPALTPTPTPALTQTPTPALTQTPTLTPTPVPTPTPTPTPAPTQVPSQTPTPTPVLTPVQTNTPTPTPAPSDGPVRTPELPRKYIDTSYSPPTGGQLIKVPGGGDLQAAINQANPGDIIELQAGAFYMGTFTFPNKSGNGWIYIVSSAYSGLPAPGTRISPLDQENMPKIISPNANSTIKFSQSSHNYRLVGIEIATLYNSTSSTNYTIVDTNIPGATQVSDLPNDIILDRCYIHGTPTGNTRRGVTANSRSLAVVDSYISDVHEVGADNQAIGGWNGPGPFKFVNNYLSGACENVIFGGSDATDESFQPQDIEIRDNYFFKPMSWYQNDPSYAGIHWSVKNLFELKNARRVLVDGNVFENHWVDAQSGPSILLTPRNQNGGNPWTIVQDVTFTNNIIRHVPAGFNILGKDNNNPSQMTNTVLIRNNLFEGVGGSGLGGNGMVFQLLGPMDNITIDHNTISASSGSIMVLDGPQSGITNLKFTSNIAPHNIYGIFGNSKGSGNSSLGYYAPDSLVTKNIIIGGGSGSNYPSGNIFVSDTSKIGFVNYNNGIGGDYHLSAASIYKNAGLDGKDIGADIDALNAATNGVVIDLGTIPTPEPPPSMTPTPTPVLTPVPTYTVGPGDFTYSFEDAPGNNVPITGIHGGVDFGSDGKWSCWITNHLWPSTTGCGNFTNNDSSNFFTLPTGKMLKSIKVASPFAGTTYIISDGVNPDVTGSITAGVTPQLVVTNWQYAGSRVTISFSNGYDSGLDDIIYGDAITEPDPGGIKSLNFSTTNQGDGVNLYTFNPGTSMKLYGVDTVAFQTWKFNNIFTDRGATDSYVQYKFDGVQADLYAESAPYCGIVGITIYDANGVEEISEQKVDFYNANNLSTALVYTSPLLKPGIHSIKIRVTGEVNSNNLTVNDGNTPPSKPYWSVNLYKLDVYSTEKTVTPSPVPTDTATPTPEPTDTETPTPQPTETPTPQPTGTPTPQPTGTPTPQPTGTPTPQPTGTPTPQPTGTPTPQPTGTPTPQPTGTPTQVPTVTPTQAPVPTFTDLTGFEWAEKYINTLANAGIIQGYPDGTFRPGNNITRAEFAKMLTVAYEIVDSTAVSTFSDVDKGEWYYIYVASAQKEGLVKGNGDGTFSPKEDMTREEMFAINARAINKYLGKDLLADNDSETEEILAEYVDGSLISDWARGFTATNIKYGYVVGSPINGIYIALNPEKAITRGEVATILGRSMK